MSTMSYEYFQHLTSVHNAIGDASPQSHPQLPTLAVVHAAMAFII